MEWAGLEGLQNPAESPNSSLMKSFSGFKRQLAQSSQFVPKWDRSRQKNEQLSEFSANPFSIFPALPARFL